MSEEELCKLCRDNQAMEVDLEKPMYKVVNKHLQRIFECYKIDVSILGESSCICQACFERVLQISESLEKWSKAQEGLQEKPLDIDDSKAFQVKLEVPSSEDEEEKSSQIEDKIEETKETEETPQKPKYDFFCVGIGQDGMALTKLFKDQTKATRLLCTCCDQVYENLVQIRMHSSLARKNPVYYCGACDANFPSARLLADHERAEEHTKSINHLLRDIEFRCLKCDEVFTRFFDAIRHENSLHSSLEFICPECNMHFKYFGSYQKHLRLHRPSQPMPEVYECTFPNCSRRFRVRQRYLKHIKWHKSQSHKCPYVGCEVTMLPGNYMRHVRSHFRQAKCLQEGKFMKLATLQRVDPDGRKVPYTRRMDALNAQQRQIEELVAPPTNQERFKINPDGEFISLPKKITLQKGRYISVHEEK